MAAPMDRRSFLARSAAAAGAVALGGAGPLLSGGSVAGAATNGPGHNGISKARPKRGGSLTFGTTAEESGFNPTSARFDNIGVMYARTVFDPLAIVTPDGGWVPYLAQSIVPNPEYTSWKITLRPTVRLPRRDVLQRRGPPDEPGGPVPLLPARPGPQAGGRDIQTDRPADGDSEPEAGLGALPLLPGRRDRRAGGLSDGPGHDQRQDRKGNRHTRSARGRSSSRSGCPTHTSPPPPGPATGARACPTWTASPSSPSSTTPAGPTPWSPAPSTCSSPTFPRTSRSTAATRQMVLHRRQRPRWWASRQWTACCST